MTKMKKQIYHYEEPRKKFYWKTLKQIQYFENLPVDIFHSIFYKFEEIFLKVGEFLLLEGDETNQLFVVDHGLLQIMILSEE